MAVIVGCKQPLLMGFVIVDGCGMVIDYEIVIILVIVIDYGYYYYLIMVIIPGYYCWWISSNGCEVINGWGPEELGSGYGLIAGFSLSIDLETSI